MTCIFLLVMYKGGPHLVFGDVGISPYRRLSGELDARGSVRVRVGGCDVRRRPEVLCRGVSCRIVSCRVVSYRVVSFGWWCLRGLGFPIIARL